MSWFGKSKKDTHRMKVANTANIEIDVAKTANHKASTQAVADANHLKELLERNHFSVTLYIAVGGKSPRKQTRKQNA